MDSTPTPDTPTPGFPDVEREAAEAERHRQIDEGLKADGLPTEDKVAYDFFGANLITEDVTLHDGVSTVTIQVLNEGQRKAFQNKTNRDVRVQRSSQDMFVRMAPGDERWALLEVAIVGWNLPASSQGFNPRNLARFLAAAPPADVDAIEKAVRMANPWLLAETSVEDLEKEIATLQDLLAKKIAEEAGNASS